VQVAAHPVTDVRDEPHQVGAVDRGVAESFAAAVAVRIKTAAADPHDRTRLALRRQGVCPDLPGNGGGMVEGSIEGIGEDMPSGVCGAGIGRAQRIELLNGTVGLHDDEGARLQAEPLHRAGLAQDELDQLGEDTNPGLCHWRRVPALEDRDQPVCVAGTGRRAAPVRVR